MSDKTFNTGTGQTGSTDNSPANAAMLLIAQGYAAWLQGGAAYLTRASTSWAAFGRVVAQQLSAVQGNDQERDSAMRVILDESVAQLRELGDMSMQEARALQQNLLALAVQLRDLDDSKTDEPRRYAKAKQ